MTTHRFTISEDTAHVRLDVFLTQQLEEAPSREFVKKLITGGKVLVNGQPVKSNHKLLAGEEVVAAIVDEDFPDERILPEPMTLDIVYEDAWVAVINKPSGLTVHPASGHYGGTLINGLMHHFQQLSDVNGDKRPGIVHRLDKETSGLIVIAKDNRSHVRLARQFEKHRVRKQYLALVRGHIQFDEGIIDAPIGTHDHYHDHRRVVFDGTGRAAFTRYVVRRRLSTLDGSRRGDSTLVALYPQTGRTHQLRLHMKHLGHPILGDDKYGSKQLFPRLALHAHGLGFTHPETDRWMEWTIPPPESFLFTN